MSYETFSRNTRNQLKQVFNTLRELMTPPEPRKRPIGFVHPKEGKDAKDGPKSKVIKTTQSAKAVKAVNAVKGKAKK